MASLGGPEEGEGRIREILDEEEREQHVRGADRTTFVTVAGTSLALSAFGALGAALVGALLKFSEGRKQARFQARVDATFRGIERRLGEFGDLLDEDFITTDEFMEMVEQQDVARCSCASVNASTASVFTLA